jgi:hypothetical protein
LLAISIIDFLFLNIHLYTATIFFSVVFFAATLSGDTFRKKFIALVGLFISAILTHQRTTLLFVILVFLFDYRIYKKILGITRLIFLCAALLVLTFIFFKNDLEYRYHRDIQDVISMTVDSLKIDPVYFTHRIDIWSFYIDQPIPIINNGYLELFQYGDILMQPHNFVLMGLYRDGILLFILRLVILCFSMRLLPFSKRKAFLSIVLSFGIFGSAFGWNYSLEWLLLFYTASNSKSKKAVPAGLE